MSHHVGSKLGCLWSWAGCLDECWVQGVLTPGEWGMEKTLEVTWLIPLEGPPNV